MSSGQQLGCGYQGCLGRIPRARDPYLSLGHILLRGSPVISRLSPLNNTFFFHPFFGEFQRQPSQGENSWLSALVKALPPRVGRVQSLASGSWTLLGSLELFLLSLWKWGKSLLNGNPQAPLMVNRKPLAGVYVHISIYVLRWVITPPLLCT